MLQPDIQIGIDTFRADNFDCSPVFAVHVRSLDKGRENPEFLRDNADMLPVLDAALAADPKLRLLLMTDSGAVLEQNAGLYGDRAFNTDYAHWRASSR